MDTVKKSKKRPASPTPPPPSSDSEKKPTAAAAAVIPFCEEKWIRNVFENPQRFQKDNNDAVVPIKRIRTMYYIKQ